MPRTIYRKQTITLRVLLTVLAAVLLLGCSDEPAEQVERESFDVQLTSISSQAQTSYVEVTGTITGRQTVPVATKLMSEILYMGFEEGERVETGELLVRIDDSDISAMRAEAAAYHAEAAAALGEVQAAISQGEAGKAQAEAALKQAEAAHQDAQADFERAERLAAEDSIPRVQRDKAELGLKVAAENVTQAESAVDQADAQIRQAEARIPQVEAKGQQASAKDAQAAALQDYTTLTAPFAGVITQKLADAGQMSIPGQPIYMLADDSGFRLEIQVAESLIASLSRGLEIDVLLEEADGGFISTSGTIASINAAANPGSHTVKVKLDLVPVPGLFAGRFARARIPAGESSGLSIPESAIVSEGEQRFVWRVSHSGLLSLVPVEICDPVAGSCLVVRGLSEGDRVVLAPTAELYSGAQVKSGAQAASH